MVINGHLKFHTLGSGELQNAVLERLATAPAGVAGRIYYNTTDNTYYYHDGSNWVSFATGGNATSIQTEVNNIESALGAMINGDGTANTTSMDSLNNVSGASTISEVLSQLDAAITGKDELGELNDVTFSGSPPGATLASGDVLQYTGTYWTNKAIGSASGIQAQDATLDALAALTGTGIMVESGTDTFIHRSIAASSVAGDEGISVVNGDGVSGNPTVGLDIVGLTAETGTPSTTDVLAMYDGTNNVKVSITQLTAAITGAGIALGDLSDVTDAQAGSLTSGDSYFFTANASSPSTYDVAAATLGALNNVASGVDSAPTDDILAFDGTKWTAISVATMLSDGSINDLGDVTVTSPANQDILYYSSGSPAGWVNGPAGATSGVQPYDAGLANLATGGTGVVAMSGDTVYWRTITGTAGNITVTDGDGTSGNPTLNLATVSQASSGNFVKVTLDSYGRVTGNTAVVAGDITALVDGTYVNVSGDTMTGNLTMSSGTDIILPDIPTAATHAVNKQYVDDLVTSGTTWEKPIVDPDLVGIVSSEPGSPQTGGGYIATAGGTWGSVTVVANDYVYWDGSAWTVVENVAAGDRFIIGGEHGTAESSLTSLGFVENALVEYNGGDISTFAGWDQPHGIPGGSPALVDGTTVLVGDAESDHYGHTYLYDATNDTWLEIAGPGSIGAGVGLSYSGSTMNVNLGAGIVELPSDEVGIDLYSPSGGAIFMTTDGSTRSTASGAKLHLMLDGSSLTQGVNGLAIATGGITADMFASSVAGAGLSITSSGSPTVTYALDVNVDGSTLEIVGDALQVKDGGITNAKLANSTISTAAETGTGSVALGGTLTLAAGEGINTVDNGSGTITISGEDASDTNKGIASFNATEFSVTSGAVSLAAGGIANTKLANDGITFAGDTGTGAETVLGGTRTIAGGTGIATSNAGQTLTVNLDATTDNLTDVSAAPSAAGQVMVAGGSPLVYTPKAIQYIHTQSSGATSWTVAHSLGQQYCNVTVVDSADEVIIPQSITFDNANQLTVTFNTAITGKVVVMGVAGVA